jgi:hypothetical protein
VSELAEPFDVSLMAISKHLKVMEGAATRRAVSFIPGTGGRSMAHFEALFEALFD